MARWSDLADWRGPTQNQDGRMVEHRGVVLHIAEGWFDGTIAWQRDPDSRVSSHFIIGRDSGQVAQLVDTDTVAWTQADGNGHWLSIEFEAFSAGHDLNPGGWEKLSEAQVQAAAELYARAHQVYRVPLQLTSRTTGKGLGHHSMGGAAWGGHYDCPGLPILRQKPTILRLAREIAGQPPPGASPKQPPGPPVQFPLPAGWYFGPASGPAASVSGVYRRRFGDRTDRQWLRVWTRQLQRRGWPAGRGGVYLHQYGNDGIYGPEYRELAVAFQADQHLAIDGLIGRQTWDAAYHNPVT